MYTRLSDGHAAHPRPPRGQTQSDATSLKDKEAV
jgi:hypothetical protein